ncbi:MAG: hypothetical protein ACT4P7_17805 [Gemmatimonadaceae bacterium]
MSFRALDAGEIIGTLERLNQRIEERFPGSGLGRVSRDLLGLARALFVQRFSDAVVLQAVNEIEDLTTALSGKIWQEITLLQVEG